jgi:hypothetical protein
VVFLVDARTEDSSEKMNLCRMKTHKIEQMAMTQTMHVQKERISRTLDKYRRQLEMTDSSLAATACVVANPNKEQINAAQSRQVPSSISASRPD